MREELKKTRKEDALSVRGYLVVRICLDISYVFFFFNLTAVSFCPWTLLSGSLF